MIVSRETGLFSSNSSPCRHHQPATTDKTVIKINSVLHKPSAYNVNMKEAIFMSFETMIGFLSISFHIIFLVLQNEVSVYIHALHGPAYVSRQRMFHNVT